MHIPTGHNLEDRKAERASPLQQPWRDRRTTNCGEAQRRTDATIVLHRLHDPAGSAG